MCIGRNNIISTTYLSSDSSLPILCKLCHHSSRDRSQPRTIGGEPSGISWCESGGVRGVSRLFIPTSVSIQLRILIYSLTVIHIAFISDLPPFSTEGLEGILNLSQVYSVPDGVEFAKNRLYAEKNNIPPAHFLSMAIKYRMPLFFMDAFSRLAHNPLHNLSSADLDLIPSSVLCKLLAVHQSIRSHRQELVLRKPASYRYVLHAAGCRRGCVSHMRVGWDTVAVPLLLSSEWFPAWRIHKLLMESLQSYGICRPCTNRYRLAFQDILPNAESEMFVKANAEARKAEGFEY